MPVSQIGEHVESLAKLVVTGGLSVDLVKSELHKNIVIQAMQKAFGNQCRAARALGVHRNTFSRWLDQYEISPLTGRRLKVAKTP